MCYEIGARSGQERRRPLPSLGWECPRPSSRLSLGCARLSCLPRARASRTCAHILSSLLSGSSDRVAPGHERTATGAPQGTPRTSQAGQERAMPGSAAPLVAKRPCHACGNPAQTRRAGCVVTHGRYSLQVSDSKTHTKRPASGTHGLGAAAEPPRPQLPSCCAAEGGLHRAIRPLPRPRRPCWPQPEPCPGRRGVHLRR